MPLKNFVITILRQDNAVFIIKKSAYNLFRRRWIEIAMTYESPTKSKRVNSVYHLLSVNRYLSIWIAETTK